MTTPSGRHPLDAEIRELNPSLTDGELAEAYAAIGWDPRANAAVPRPLVGFDASDPVGTRAMQANLEATTATSPLRLSDDWELARYDWLNGGPQERASRALLRAYGQADALPPHLRTPEAYSEWARGFEEGHAELSQDRIGDSTLAELARGGSGARKALGSALSQAGQSLQLDHLIGVDSMLSDAYNLGVTQGYASTSDHGVAYTIGNMGAGIGATIAGTVLGGPGAGVGAAVFTSQAYGASLSDYEASAAAGEHAYGALDQQLYAGSTAAFEFVTEKVGLGIQTGLGRAAVKAGGRVGRVAGRTAGALARVGRWAERGNLGTRMVKGFSAAGMTEAAEESLNTLLQNYITPIYTDKEFQAWGQVWDELKQAAYHGFAGGVVYHPAFLAAGASAKRDARLDRHAAFVRSQQSAADTLTTLAAGQQSVVQAVAHTPEHQRGAVVAEYDTRADEARESHKAASGGLALAVKHDSEHGTEVAREYANASAHASDAMRDLEESSQDLGQAAESRRGRQKDAAERMISSLKEVGASSDLSEDAAWQEAMAEVEAANRDNPLGFSPAGLTTAAKKAFAAQAAYEQQRDARAGETLHAERLAQTVLVASAAMDATQRAYIEAENARQAAQLAMKANMAWRPGTVEVAMASRPGVSQVASGDDRITGQDQAAGVMLESMGMRVVYVDGGDSPAFWSAATPDTAYVRVGNTHAAVAVAKAGHEATHFISMTNPGLHQRLVSAVGADNIADGLMRYVELGATHVPREKGGRWWLADRATNTVDDSMGSFGSSGEAERAWLAMLDVADRDAVMIAKMMRAGELPDTAVASAAFTYLELEGLAVALEQGLAKVANAGRVGRTLGRLGIRGRSMYAALMAMDAMQAEVARGGTRPWSPSVPVESTSMYRRFNAMLEVQQQRRGGSAGDRAARTAAESTLEALTAQADDAGESAITPKPGTRPGEQGSLFARDAEQPATVTMPARVGDVFTSRLQRAIIDVDRDQIQTPLQLRNYLGRQHVKPEEMLWTGLGDYLDSMSDDADIDWDTLSQAIGPVIIESTTQSQSHRSGTVIQMASVPWGDYLPKGTGARTNLVLTSDIQGPQIHNFKVQEGQSVLVHIRGADVTSTTDGEEAFYVGEIQSDWSTAIGRAANKTQTSDRTQQIARAATRETARPPMFEWPGGVGRHNADGTLVHRDGIEGDELLEWIESQRHWFLGLAFSVEGAPHHHIWLRIRSDSVRSAYERLGHLPTSLEQISHVFPGDANRHLTDPIVLPAGRTLVDGVRHQARRELSNIIRQVRPVAAPFVTKKKQQQGAGWKPLALKRVLAHAAMARHGDQRSYTRLLLPNSELVNSASGIWVEGDVYREFPEMLDGIIAELTGEAALRKSLARASGKTGRKAVDTPAKMMRWLETADLVRTDGWRRAMDYLATLQPGRAMSSGVLAGLLDIAAFPEGSPRGDEVEADAYSLDGQSVLRESLQAELAQRIEIDIENQSGQYVDYLSDEYREYAAVQELLDGVIDEYYERATAIIAEENGIGLDEVDEVDAESLAQSLAIEVFSDAGYAVLVTPFGDLRVFASFEEADAALRADIEEAAAIVAEDVDPRDYGIQHIPGEGRVTPYRLNHPILEDGRTLADLVEDSVEGGDLTLFARSDEMLEGLSHQETIRLRAAANRANNLDLEEWAITNWITALEDSEHARTLSIPSPAEAMEELEDGTPVYQAFRIPGMDAGYAIKRIKTTDPKHAWPMSSYDGYEITGVVSNERHGGMVDILIAHAISRHPEARIRLDAFDVLRPGAAAGDGKLPYLYTKNGFVKYSSEWYDVQYSTGEKLASQIEAWQEDGWTPEYDYAGPTPEHDGVPVPSNLPEVWAAESHIGLTADLRQAVASEGLGRWADLQRELGFARAGRRAAGRSASSDQHGVGVDELGSRPRAGQELEQAEGSRVLQPGDRQHRGAGTRGSGRQGQESVLPAAAGRDGEVQAAPRVNLTKLAAALREEAASQTTEELADMITGLDLLPGREWYEAQRDWLENAPRKKPTDAEQRKGITVGGPAKRGPEWERFKALADAHAQSLGFEGYSKVSRMELQRYLEMRTQAAYAEIRGTEQAGDPRFIEMLSTAFAKEIVHAFRTGEMDASDWYAANIEEMWQEVSDRDDVPELSADHPNIEENRVAFSLLLAILSNGAAVEENMGHALRAFKEHMRTGEMPNVASTYRDSDALQIVFALRDHMGSWVAVDQWLQDKGTVGNINVELQQLQADMAENGITLTKPNGKAITLKIDGEPADSDGFRSWVIGPKLGSFYLNLRGNFDPLTMDVWWMRSVGRLVGRIMESAAGSERATIAKLRGIQTVMDKSPAKTVDWMLREITSAVTKRQKHVSKTQASIDKAQAQLRKAKAAITKAKKAGRTHESHSKSAASNARKLSNLKKAMSKAKRELDQAKRDYATFESHRTDIKSLSKTALDKLAEVAKPYHNKNKHIWDVAFGKFHPDHRTKTAFLRLQRANLREARGKIKTQEAKPPKSRDKRVLAKARSAARIAESNIQQANEDYAKFRRFGFDAALLTEGGFTGWMQASVLEYERRKYKEPDPVRKAIITPINTLRKNTRGSKDVPSSGSDRASMREMAIKAIEKANDMLGLEDDARINNASGQALEWYFEKGIYNVFLTGKNYGTPTGQDFAKAASDASLNSRWNDERQATELGDVRREFLDQSGPSRRSIARGVLAAGTGRVSDDALLDIYRTAKTDDPRWQQLHRKDRKRARGLYAGWVQQVKRHPPKPLVAPDVEDPDIVQARDQRVAWIKKRGVKRIANMIAARLSRKGFRVEVDGTDSQYVQAFDDDGFVGDVRVSLHQQAVGGGFNVGRQDRMGESVASIDPHTTTTVDEAVQAVVNESLDSRWSDSLETIRSGKATSAVPVGRTEDLFLRGLSKKKRRRIAAHLGVAEMPTLVTVKPHLIREKSASGFGVGKDAAHRIPDYVWDDLLQYLSDPLAITEHRDKDSGKARLNVWIRSALRLSHSRGPKGKAGGIDFTAPIMVGVSVVPAYPGGPPSFILTTAFAPEDMDRLSKLQKSGGVLYALESAAKVKQRQADIWTIADVRQQKVRQIKPKNETPRLSRAASASNAEGESTDTLPSDQGNVNNNPGDSLDARDTIPAPSVRQTVTDYRTASAVAKQLRDQARGSSDPTVAASLRAAAREITAEAEAARKDYRDLRRQKAAQQKASNTGYRAGLEVGRQRLREKLAAIERRSNAEQSRNLRTRLRAEEKAAQGAVRELRRELAEIKRAAKAAIMTLPMSQRGRFLGRALEAKSLADVAKISRQVVVALTTFEVQSTRQDVKALRKRFRKRGMSNRTRKLIAEALDQAYGLLTGEDNRIIALDSMTELLERLRLSRQLIEAATDVYLRERATWKESVRMRRAKMQDDRDQAVGNLQQTAHARRRPDVESTTDRPNSLRRRWTGSLDADGLFEVLEGKGSVLRVYWGKIRDAKGRMWIAKRDVETRSEAAIQRAGYKSKEDFLARTTDMYGEGAAETVTVILGGADRTITLSDAMGLAAIDNDTYHALPRDQAAIMEEGPGPGIVWRAARDRRAIQASQDEVDLLRETLGVAHMELIADLKNILEEDIRPSVFQVHYEQHGRMPPEVENYWPRARRRADLGEDLVGDNFTSPDPSGPSASDIAVNAMLDNMGMTQARTGGGSAIMIGGLMHVFDQHVDDGLMLIHLSRPLREFDGLLRDERVSSAVAERMGDAGVRQIREFLAYAVGLTGVESSNDPLARVQGNVAGAYLMASVKTWVRMFGGAFRLLAEMPNTRAWLRGMGDVRNMLPGTRGRMIEQIERQSGYFYERHRRSQVGRYSNLIRDARARRQFVVGIAAFGRAAKKVVDSDAHGAIDRVVKAARAARVGGGAIMAVLTGMDHVLRAIDRQIMLIAVRGHMASGMTFAEAVTAAEMSFRRSQNTSDGADDVMDAARIKGRTGQFGLLRPFLLFSSDPLKAHNQIRSALRTAQSDPARAARTAAAVTINTALSVSVGYAFAAGMMSWWDDDDDDDRRILNEAILSKEAGKARRRALEDVVATSGGVLGWGLASVFYWADRAIAGERTYSDPLEVAALSELTDMLSTLATIAHDTATDQLDTEDAVRLLADVATVAGIPVEAPLRDYRAAAEIAAPADPADVLRELRARKREGTLRGVRDARRLASLEQQQTTNTRREKKGLEALPLR